MDVFFAFFVPKPADDDVETDTPVNLDDGSSGGSGGMNYCTIA
jgi:hypothetical protein